MTQPAAPRSTSSRGVFTPAPAPAPVLDLPVDKGIERALLGALLNDRQPGNPLFERVKHLTKDHFSEHAHKLLWRAMAHLHDEGLTIDAVTVKETLLHFSALNKASYFDQVGEALLSDLMIDAGTEVATYAQALERVFWRRDAYMKLTTQGLKWLTDRTVPSDVVVSNLMTLMTDLLVSGAVLTAPPAQSLVKQLDAFETMYAALDPREARGAASGFPQLDELIGGLGRGELYMFGAFAGIGKSTITHNIALTLMRSGLRGIIISNEMREIDYLYRTLSIESGVPARLIEEKRLNSEMAERLTRASERLATYRAADHFHTVYLKKPTLAQIKAKIVELHSTGGLDFVVMDYISERLITPPDNIRPDNIAGILGKFSDTLLDLAHDLNLIMIGVAQTTRESQERSGPPQLNDLYGSSSMAKDASAVMILKEVIPFSSDAGYGRTEMYVVKVRKGMKGMIPLQSRLDCYTFLEWGVGL